MMPPRRGRSPNLAVLLVAFSIGGIVYFQIVKERRASDALLDEKAAETSKFRRHIEEVTEIADELRQTVSRLMQENEKLAAEKSILYNKLVELEREKISSENEKRDLVETFQEKKDEIDNLKQKLVHLQENEAEIVSLKVKVDSLEEEMKSAKADHIEDVQKLGTENSFSVENVEEDQSVRAQRSKRTEPEKVETKISGNNEERASNVQQDEKNLEEFEEEGQRQEKGFSKTQELEGGLVMETRDADDNDQANESEILSHEDVNKPNENAGDGREEQAETIEENKEDHEEDKDEEGNQTESFEEKEDASNTFSKEEEVSDLEEAHLESLENNIHEVDQDEH